MPRKMKSIEQIVNIFNTLNRGDKFTINSLSNGNKPPASRPQITNVINAMVALGYVSTDGKEKTGKRGKPSYIFQKEVDIDKNREDKIREMLKSIRSKNKKTVELIDTQNASVPDEEVVLKDTEVELKDDGIDEDFLKDFDISDLDNIKS